MAMTMAMVQDPLHKRMMEVVKETDPDGLILEAWAQGFMVGGIIVMMCITLANIKRGVLLHKLILLELFLGFWHGTFIFNKAPVYGWYLSVTAVFLNLSWSLHNVIAWLKNRPFMGRKTSMIFLGTLILAQPYWILEIYANFAYFNNINDLFLHTRPYEAIFRDPWWIFTTCSLFYNIRTRYEFKYFELMYISPRFGVMLMAMMLSIIFTILDILFVTDAIQSALPVGINPFWKLAFVFKLLTDSVILDDFKTALDKLCRFNLSRIEDHMQDSWPARRNTVSENGASSAPRQPRSTLPKGGVQVKSAALRSGSGSDSSGNEAWIEVRTETTVESIRMDEMNSTSPKRVVPRAF